MEEDRNTENWKERAESTVRKKSPSRKEESQSRMKRTQSRGKTAESTAKKSSPSKTEGSGSRTERTEYIAKESNGKEGPTSKKKEGTEPRAGRGTESSGKGRESKREESSSGRETEPRKKGTKSGGKESEPRTEHRGKRTESTARSMSPSRREGSKPTTETTEYNGKKCNGKEPESRNKETESRGKGSESPSKKSLSQSSTERTDSRDSSRNQEYYSCDRKEEVWESLKKLKYCHGNMDRDYIERLLKRPGQYALRITNDPKNHKKKRACISVQSKERCHHFIIHQEEQGKEEKYFISSKLKFDSIKKLLTHYIQSKDPLSDEGRPKLRKPLRRKKWELTHEQVEYKKKLGEGEFGAVFKAILKKKRRVLGEKEITVAVKQSSQASTKSQREMFLKEARTMMDYGHPHIVKLIGVAAMDEPILIVMEYANGGSLLNQLEEKTGKMTDEDRIRYSTQAARGMEYLEQKGCIHRDVASRNCLLFGINKDLKIADFGLSQTSETCQNETNERLPIKWLAPETILKKTFTAKSDIWSFGILLWEIYSDGDEPYPEMGLKETQKKVVGGYRMTPPPGTPTEVADAMRECWKPQEKRPTFKELREILETLYKKNH